jgi:hypothetical protein
MVNDVFSTLLALQLNHLTEERGEPFVQVRDRKVEGARVCVCVCVCVCV